MGTTTCTYEASTTTCVGPTYNGPAYGDWLLVNAVLLVFMAMLAWPRFSIVTKR